VGLSRRSAARTLSGVINPLYPRGHLAAPRPGCLTRGLANSLPFEVRWRHSLRDTGGSFSSSSSPWWSPSDAADDSGMPASPRPLWTCPKCKHRFVTKNLWHSCVRVPLRTHFRGQAARLYPTFRAWAALARTCGPVTIYAQKSRIVIQARVRFAGAVVRASYVDATLWLKRPVQHPRLRRTESFGALGYGLHFHLASPADIDRDLARLMHEAYRMARGDRPRPRRDV